MRFLTAFYIVMAKNPTSPTETADEWLRTSDLKSILKCGDSRVRQLIREKAFPVSRPYGRTIYARRSDVEQFMVKGFQGELSLSVQ